MRKQKLPTYKIFRFEDLDMDNLRDSEFLYETHIKLNYPMSEDSVDTDLLKLIQSQTENKISKIQSVRKCELIEKYHFLIHLIITKTFVRGFNSFNANLLQYMFGREYQKMIKTLCHLGYISRSEVYEVGKMSRNITIQRENIICRQKYSQSFERYLQKYMNYEGRQTHTNEGDNLLPKQYKPSMKQLRVIDEENARAYIDQNKSLSQYAKERYHWILDEYNDRNFNVIMRNDNRIYSLLTYTPKDLKHYLNIKYQLDISNSHPLLFSYFIIQEYSIPISVLNILSYSNINNSIPLYNNIYLPSSLSYIQYDMNVLDKLLKDNGIDYREINNIKLDQLMYIYLTFHGVFWEVFMKMEGFENVPRHIIKIEMFKEVFYGNILGGKKRLYVNQFKKMFPNVYKMILSRRREVRSSQKQHLAHDMMSLESEIIQKILKRLYSSGYCVVSIHDAIVVLDTEVNIPLNANEVEQVIKEEYSNYNLMASTKVDYFNPCKANDRLKVINQNHEAFSSVMEELLALSNDPNEPDFKVYKERYTNLMTGRDTIEFNEQGYPYLCFGKRF